MSKGLVFFMIAKINRTPVLLSLLISFFLISCSANEVNYEELEGSWKTISAKRNGKTTQTLENVTFNYSKDNKMSTNIFGQEEIFEIEYSYPLIKIESSKITEINVKKLNGDTLFISSKINQFRYDLNLIKVIAEQ